MIRFRSCQGLSARACLVAVGLMPFVFACATSQEELGYLNQRIGAVDNSMGMLEESMSQKLSAELELVRSAQTETVAQMDMLKSEMESLTGRVEENSHLMRRGIARDTTDQDMMKASIAALSDRVKRLDAMIAGLYGHLGIPRPDVEPEAMPARGEPVSTGDVQIPRATEDVAPLAQDKGALEKRHYESAHTLFRDGMYDEAIAGFEDFTERYAESDLADNAFFWIGESHMASSRYEQAILSYQEVIKKYPRGNKVASAMLRQAHAFSQLKDQVSSRLLLKKVITNFPDSSEARIAATKLKKMN